MGKLASENSRWLKEYTQRVNRPRNKSNGNKWLIPLIITLILGAFIGIMIANGALNDPQKIGGIKIMGVIAGVMLLVSIILIAKGKKKVASSRTEDNLNELLQSVEEVKAFDEQMAAGPIFKVENSSDNYYFATKDFFGRRFSDMGDETYTFVRVRDISSLHYQALKGDGLKFEYLFDLRNAEGEVLLNGRLENTACLESLEEGLQKVLSGLSLIGE